MYTKLIFSILTLITLLISGCTTSSITLQPNNLEIKHDEQAIDISGDLLEKRTVNISPALIYQSLFKTKEGEILVYEYTDLDQDYRFNYGTSRSMDIIFEAKHVKTSFQFNNLHFYQVERKDGSYINLLVQQSDDQTLVFVTGFSTKEFKEMIKEVDREQKAGDYVLKEAFTTKDPKKAVASKWNMRMIAIDIIFSPVARMMP